MTQVIINDETPREQFTASGAQTVFSTLFTADAASDVKVYGRAAGVPADDAAQLILDTNYTVTFIGALATVRVTFNVGRTAGDIITIVRDTPSERENLYLNTNFTPTMLNQDFGLLTLIDQQNQMYDTVINPGYNVSATINGTVDTVLPILEANQLWVKNSTDTAIIAYDIPASGIAPGNGTYLVQTANLALPDAQVMASLGTGIVKNTSGTGVQSISTAITSLENTNIVADKLPYGDGVNSYALTDLTAYSRSLFAGANAAAWQAALGIVPAGTFFAIANNLSEGVPGTMRTNLGLVIGTDVQAQNATLQSLSSLGTAADRIAYTTGVNTWAETGLTAYMRTVLDDANAATAAATLAVLPLSGGTLTGNLILNGDPTVGSQAATKSYVDAVVQNQQIACLVATTGNLVGYTYANGAAGVGATLTAPAVGVLTIDGVNPALSDRILVKSQTAPAENGAYTLTTVGTAGVAAILTRATDYDQAAEMQAGDQFAVVSGTANAATIWMMSQTAAITVGTTAITFAQVGTGGALLIANNLSDLSNVSTARTNLGLVIGTNVQAQDATLQSISALGTAANKTLYTTGIDTWTETDINAFGRSMLNVTTANSAAIVTTNAGVPVATSTMTNGQIVIGSTGATPVAATITAGSGITVTNGAGTITIASTGGGGTGGGLETSLLLMGG